MAVVRWIYSSLDERRMSQRRHVAEVALRSAMKSGGPSQLHGCFCLGSRHWRKGARVKTSGFGTAMSRDAGLIC